MSQIPAPPALHEALLGHTGFLLSRIGMVAQKQFAERDDPLGVTPRMWGALNVLYSEGAISQHALCKGVGMDPSSMVATIDELEAKGLVERHRDPQDRRAHALHVTAKGKRALTAGRALARDAQNDLLAPLNREERAQLHGLLLQLITTSSCDLPNGPAQAEDAKAAAGRA